MTSLTSPVRPALALLCLPLPGSEEMEAGTWWAVAAAATAVYMAWFWRMSRGLSGPRVWPLVGSLPGLVRHAEDMHEWIAANLRRAGGTYQTCIFAVPGVARRGGLVTVTGDPRNLEHVLKARFDNYPKGPFWHAVFRDLLGDGIFNSDGETWVAQRKTAALEFTTRTLRTAMSRWVSRSIHGRLLPILGDAAADGAAVDLQDLLLRLTFGNIGSLAFGKDPQWRGSWTQRQKSGRARLRGQQGRTMRACTRRLRPDPRRCGAADGGGERGWWLETTGVATAPWAGSAAVWGS